MWSFKRIALIALVSVSVGACGFQPLYSARSGSNKAVDEFALIQIRPIKDRIGQLLRNKLFAHLNPNGEPSQPRYVLKVTLEEAIQNLGIRKDATATRANLTLNATYSLLADGQSIYSNSSQAAASYNILTATYATVAAKSDAEKRALENIADRIRAELALFFTGRQGGA